MISAHHGGRIIYLDFNKGKPSYQFYRISQKRTEKLYRPVREKMKLSVKETLQCKIVSNYIIFQ